MSMVFVFFCLMVPLTMPSAVLSSVRIGVGGCGWPSPMRVRQRGMENLAFRKRVSTSASAADAMVFLMILAMMAMELLTSKPLELLRR